MAFRAERERPAEGGGLVPDLAALQARHGVSAAAVDLLRRSAIIDLHIDTFIPPRLWGYDIFRRHGPGLLRGHFFGHLDVPRIQEGGLAGAGWSITTNPWRTAAGRWRTFLRNLARLRALMDASGGALRLARTATEYRAARAAGAHAVLPAIQGGNALDAAPGGAADLPDAAITRVTLVHLTNSPVGATSSPFCVTRRDKSLTAAGRRLVEQLDAARIFVDLAHIHPTGFWQAVDAHDRRLPLIVTHTGVTGVRPHWRNLDDRQIRAVADSGGVVGIMYADQFLRRRGGPRDAGMVVEHLEHAIRVGGEACAALGTDYDGAITPPPDLRCGTSYVRLIQAMLERGFGEERIQRVLGENFLRSFEEMRP